MAPEAASASLEIDARADLYSLGVVAYFLLSGVQPFFGVNAKEVMRRHMEERPLAPSEKLGQPLAPEIEDLVLKLLAKDPDSRPPIGACGGGDARRGHRADARPLDR